MLNMMNFIFEGAPIDDINGVNKHLAPFKEKLMKIIYQVLIFNRFVLVLCYIG